MKKLFSGHQKNEAVMQVEAVDVERDLLGEGPVWDARINALYWADQLGKRVRRLNPATGEYSEWKVDTVLGCIVLTSEINVLLIALTDGLYTLDLRNSHFSRIVHLPQPRTGVRLNDGRADRSGRLIFGSVTTDGGEPAGVVYRLLTNGTVETLREGMAIVNAICCSPDGRRIYYTDSREGLIYVRDCDLKGNWIGEEQIFTDMKPHGGAPDGATVDAQGGVWIAQIMGGKVFRFSSDGVLDRVIEMPAPYVSSVAFGGEHLDVLYVTSVRETGMLISTEHEEAGKLFAITGLGVTGIAEPYLTL
ncbi:SMP-30/gluconolactonase/LRE family protein [Pseudomonas fluorescens]|nr:SMP-30/gluconolactonase/LRE family protein [Pseudomonas fluorescens]